MKGRPKEDIVVLIIKILITCESPETRKRMVSANLSYALVQGGSST